MSTEIDTALAWVRTQGASLTWSGITFLLGALVGNWLTRNWDRTKEFNTLSDPVRQQIRRELGDIRANAHFVDTSAIELLADVARPIRRSRIRKALGKYTEARQQHKVQDPAYGEFSYTRTDHVEIALKKLLKLTARQ